MVIAWLRRHHWIHTWSRWERVSYKVWILSRESKVDYQDRQCEVCGLIQSVKV